MTLDERVIDTTTGLVGRPEGDPHTWDEQYEGTGPWLEQQGKLAQKLNESLKELRKQTEQIKNDKHLNPYGKQVRLQQLREEWEKEQTAEAKKLIEQLDDAHGELQAKLEKAVDSSKVAGPQDPQERFVDALRQFELRQHLMQMEHGQRLALYQQAAKDGDNELMRAVENAHPALRMVPKDTVKQVKRQRVENEFPSFSKKLSALDNIKQAHEHNLRMFNQHLRSITAWQGGNAA
jgi:hypothetical protein